MNNDKSLQVATPASVSLLDMRMDSKTYPRISTYPEEQADYEMAKIVSQAFLYRGQAADPTNVQFISSALVGELLEDRQYGLRNLCFAEIGRVVKKAVLGGSEMMGINVASLYKVIVEYAKGEGHRLQEEVNKVAQEKRQEALRQSIIAPMLTAYAGEIIRNNNNNK